MNATDAPPPQELTWDSPIKDLFFDSYSFSDDLIDPATPPRFIRMYADRWQINWQLSGEERAVRGSGGD